ncbi:hypothetical protein [Mucilaginibacter pocheonensis]|uniref:Mn-dependent DtxR family transcriptional regulator n=1 Tax=Mucilaginibacter pocheonensis TaxID=398050 RepID=A0ABU1TI45_9SPHI|nr:hypothetical protein [Mucilaginibacter pocheonensis]MDR6945063.1 Mn-dependent DtxR family transcriptional regulator [Mucilaginibacter pocheonensis]
MTKPTNYLRVLQYLEEYEGDGLFHCVEDVLEVNKQQRKSILIDLAREGLITLIGGHEASSITFGSGIRLVRAISLPKPRLHLKAQSTLKSN